MLVLSSLFPVLSWFEFYYGPVAPAIFFLGQFLDGLMEFWVGGGAHDAGTRRKCLPYGLYGYVRICLQVSQPVGSRIFCNHKETAIELGEPDFDFPWPPGLAAMGC
jgi:hypothetical protein